VLTGQRQTKVLLWTGFGGLLLLMLVLGSSAVSFLYQVELRQERIRQELVAQDRSLEQLRSGIFLTGTYVRNFLLDRAQPPSPVHKAQFEEVRRQIENSLAECARQVPAADPALQSARRAIGDYLNETASVFSWTTEERAARSYAFMEQELLPHRTQMLGVADRLRELSERQLELSGQAVSALLGSFLFRLAALSLLALALGSTLAGITLSRILRLEHEAASRLEEATEAREQMARLSAELLAAQEDERRRISRELHDEVGQTLYAAVLSLGNLRSSIAANQTGDVQRELQLLNDLTERTASVVRNIALLLRPAMLDDLGLIPALKWLAREATRTQPVPVDVDAESPLANLPDDHVTCVYRIVQESIHNAEKHSHARSIQVELKEDRGGLTVRIADDGRGFAPDRESGLGILGMRERATRAGGSLAIESAPGRGTAVLLHLPGTDSPGAKL
jgi:signal transduction histidine kinase